MRGVSQFLDIAVQQQIVFGIYLGKGFVITVGKAPVALENDEFYFWKGGLEQFDALVCRCIIGHIDLGLVARILEHGGQILAKHVGAIPVQNHYCYFLFHQLLTINS